MTDFPETEDLLRRRLLVHMRQYGLEQVIPAVRLDVRFVDSITTALAVRLRTEVATDTFARDEYHDTVHVPSSWWQMLKRDHAPAWVVRRWPVRTTPARLAVTVERMHTYPHARLPASPFGQHYVYEHVEQHLTSPWKAPSA